MAFKDFPGLAQGVTLLVSEQQVNRVLGLVDVAAVVDRGRIVHVGPPEEALGVLEAGLSQRGRSAR